MLCGLYSMGCHGTYVKYVKWAMSWRKGSSDVCDQQRLWSACISVQSHSDQWLPVNWLSSGRIIFYPKSIDIFFFLFFHENIILCHLWPFITKTCLYNFDPLKPHFYRVKLGFTGVYIIFLISAQNIDCGYLLELPHWGGSNRYPQSMFCAETWQISEFFYLIFFIYCW